MTHCAAATTGGTECAQPRTVTVVDELLTSACLKLHNNTMLAAATMSASTLSEAQKTLKNSQNSAQLGSGLQVEGRKDKAVCTLAEIEPEARGKNK